MSFERSVEDLESLSPPMAEPSSEPGPDAEPPDDPERGADGPLVDAPGWARLLLVLAPFALGGLVILLLRALGG